MPAYEIYITVNVHNGQDEMQWRWHAANHRWTPIRSIHASGVHTIQHILTKFCERNNYNEAITYAQTLAEQLTRDGLSINRIQMSTPIYNPEIADVNLQLKRDQYWEAQLCIDGAHTYGELQRLINSPSSASHECRPFVQYPSV